MSLMKKTSMLTASGRMKRKGESVGAALLCSRVSEKPGSLSSRED